MMIGTSIRAESGFWFLLGIESLEAKNQPRYGKPNKYDVWYTHWSLKWFLLGI
jgi:hypothetical protein